MPRRVCGLCEARPRGEKLASMYWAWFNSEDERSAWKLHCCKNCMIEAFGSLLVKSNSDSTDEDTCVGCGGTLESDLDVVFLTLYLPKQEPREFELETCASCAARLKAPIQNGGEKLPDRSGRGPSPEAPSSGTWTDLPF